MTKILSAIEMADAWLRAQALKPKPFPAPEIAPAPAPAPIVSEPENEKGVYHRADVWKFSASDKLRIANGENLKAPKPPRKGLVKTTGPGQKKVEKND